MYSQMRWLIPAGLVCATVGLNVESAKAQSNVNNEFEIAYDTLAQFL